ncbi:MAG: hypothetical protein KDD53_03725 [Bdellovibrionales bacterium]|nr:hypothetical protein [Bdellovibrionales bacterium]
MVFHQTNPNRAGSIAEFKTRCEIDSPSSSITPIHISSVEDYENALIDAIDAGIDDPAGYLEEHYLVPRRDLAKSNLLSLLPEKKPEMLSSLTEQLGREANEFDIEKARKILWTKTIGPLYASVAAFYEARSTYEHRFLDNNGSDYSGPFSQELKDEDPDLINLHSDKANAFRSARFHLDSIISAESLAITPIALTADPKVYYPKSVTDEMLKFAEFASELAKGPEAHIFRVSNPGQRRMFYRFLRNSCETVLDYFRAHPELEASDEIRKIREDLFQASKTWARQDGFEDIKGNVESIGAMSMLAQHSHHFRVDNPDVERQFIDPAKTEVLARYIRDGLTLIREGRYSDADKHFRNAALLQECALKFSEGSTYFLGRVDPESISIAIEQAASRSWFKTDGTVAPSFAALPKGFDLSNLTGELREKTARLVDDFLREVVLIQAEEWIHAWQHAYGGSVSQRGALLEAESDLGIRLSKQGDAFEIDVAEVFREHRIPLSDTYLSRYGRNKARIRLNGIQTDQEGERIKALIAKLDVEELVTIGLDNRTGISIRVDRNLDPYNTISERHLGLMRTQDNTWRISPLAPGDRAGNALFLRNPTSGYWEKVNAQRDVPPESQIRVGPYFEITLP